MRKRSPGNPGCSAGVPRGIHLLAAVLATVVAGGALPVAAAAAPGDLDTSFGNGGLVRTPIPESSQAYAISRQSDGKLVVAGCRFDSSVPSQLVVARYTPSGALDPSFGEDGIASVPFPGSSSGFCGHGGTGSEGGEPTTDLAIRPNDKIVLVGGANRGEGDPQSFAVAQLTPGGQLDGTFGDGGRVLLHPGDPADPAHAKAVVLEPNGRAIIAGAAQSELNDGDPELTSFAAVRIDADGTPDLSFGAGGEFVLELTENAPVGSDQESRVADIVRYPDGRIGLVGTAYDNWADGDGQYRYRLAAVRLDANGQLDSSFSGDGKLVTPVRGVNDFASAHAAALTTDGRLTVGLRYNEYLLAPDYYAGAAPLIARFEEDGDLDPTFGSNGSTLLDFNHSGGITALGYQTDGKLIAAGAVDNYAYFAVARLDAAGGLDASFGSGGITLGPPFGPADPWDSARPDDLLLDSSGDIVVAGHAGADSESALQFALARYQGDTPPPPPPLHYTALGDSVASGEGINYGFQWQSGGAGSGHWEHTGPDNPIWDGDFQDCHQSSQAYPNDLAITLNVDLTQLACTGASAEFGLLKPGINNVPPEPELGNGSSANAVYDASKPDIVTLSVGADDLHFEDVVTNCYKSLSDCHPDPTNDLAAEKANLVEVLTEIKQRGEATGKVPLVLLTTYYDPFPAQYPLQPSDCVDLAPFHIPFTSKGLLSNYEMGVLRNDLLFLNHNIRSAAAQFSNVLVVDPPAAFQQHKWCSTDPWVYGPSIDAPSFEHPTGWDNPAPFHPTPEGQTAIADELASAISDAQIVPTGENINVPFGPGASVTFDQVTSSGSVVLAPEGSGPALPPSDNHVRQSAFDIATSAGYQGDIRVSAPSSQPAVLYHYTNGAWQQVADSTFDGHNVTGSVTSLSPFALGTPAPQVHASFTETGAGEAPASVSFDASGSSVDSGGTIADYQWDFGDGTTGTGETPTHPYTRSGSYQVVLRATSDQGAVATASGIVVVSNSPPTAAIGAPTQAALSQVISFSGAESSDPNGSISDWVWDFGDSSGTQTGREVQHSYETPGTYAVTLIALDDEGAAGSATTQVQVSAPLAAPLSDTVPPDTRIAADTVPPDTRITSGPKRRSKKRNLRFRFTEDEAGSTFRCKLDHHAFASCVSPRTYRVKPGVHLFQVYAIDAAGNRDTTPAKWKFKVTRRHRARESGNV